MKKHFTFLTLYATNCICYIKYVPLISLVSNWKGFYLDKFEDWITGGEKIICYLLDICPFRQFWHTHLLVTLLIIEITGNAIDVT